MTAKNKIRLVVAASYGSMLFYNSAFAAWTRSLPRSRSSDLTELDKNSEGLEVFSPRAIMRVKGIDECTGRQNSARPELASSEKRLESFPAFRSESRSTASDQSLIRDLRSSRRPTMTDFLFQRGNGRMSAEAQERNLARTIREHIIRCTQEASPAFVRFVVDGFAKAHRKRSEEERHATLERMLNLRLMDRERFMYVTRGDRPPQEAMALYEHAGECVQGESGVIKQIKDRVMDETLLIIQRFIYPEIPNEAIEQLEEYIDSLLIPLGDALVDVVFELLGNDDFISVGCCGCCKKLSREDKQLLVGAAVQIIGSVLGRIFPGVEQGANVVAQVIYGSIQQSCSANA
jgi:hypothetical protein